MSDLKEHGIEVKTIDGMDYEFYLLKTQDSLRIFTYLLKTFGPAFGDLLEPLFSIASQAKEKKLTPGELLEAAGNLNIDKSLTTVSQALRADDLIHTCQLMIGTVRIGGKKIPFDNYFQGKTLLLFKVTGYALYHNYSDFFFAISGAASTSQMEDNTSPDDQTSTGAYGESSTQATQH